MKEDFQNKIVLEKSIIIHAFTHTRIYAFMHSCIQAFKHFQIEAEL